MGKCLFCGIIKKKVAAVIVFEDKHTLAFKDINPKAKVHFLIVPKKHIESIKSPGSEKYVSSLVLTAKKIARKEKIAGYKLVFNVGKEGGQMIKHLHLHFLTGGSIELP